LAGDSANLADMPQNGRDLKTILAHSWWFMVEYAIYGGTAAIFGGVCLYIYIFFFFGHGASLCISGVPRGAFLLGHVASSDFPLCDD
jgi:hypothetical protein